MEEDRMAVTVKDIARVADVSIATVSRALNGLGSVTGKTRAHVLKVAADLGYIPHAGARSLSSRRTQCVGVVLPDLYGEFFSEVIRGIDRIARSQGLHLLLSSSHGDVEELAAALRAMRGRVDGLLVMSPHVDADMLDQNVPSVHADGPHEHAPAGREAFVGERGQLRRRGGDGSPPRRTRPPPDRDDRRAGRQFRRARAPARFPRDAPAAAPGRAALVLRGDFSEEAGYRAGRQLLSMTTRPDAVFAANDMMAIGCLFALHEGGVRVPEDIALAGFDDIPIARYVAPPLTTVRVRIAEMGEFAIERLLQAMADPSGDRVTTQLLLTELVVRSSCSRPSGRVVAMPSKRKRLDK
jgi:LacI family transcriptional regulator